MSSVGIELKVQDNYPTILEVGEYLELMYGNDTEGKVFNLIHGNHTITSIQHILGLSHNTIVDYSLTIMKRYEGQYVSGLNIERISKTEHLPYPDIELVNYINSFDMESYKHLQVQDRPVISKYDFKLLMNDLGIYYSFVSDAVQHLSFNDEIVVVFTYNKPTRTEDFMKLDPYIREEADALLVRMENTYN